MRWESKTSRWRIPTLALHLPSGCSTISLTNRHTRIQLMPCANQRPPGAILPALLAYVQVRHRTCSLQSSRDTTEPERSLSWVTKTSMATLYAWLSLRSSRQTIFDDGMHSLPRNGLQAVHFDRPQDLRSMSGEFHVEKTVYDQEVSSHPGSGKGFKLGIGS